MGPRITYPRTNEAWFSESAASFKEVEFSHSARHNTPAKLLLLDKDGSLIPCDYQNWNCSSGYDMAFGICFVPSGLNPVDLKNLTMIKSESFESNDDPGDDFSYSLEVFICDLMKNPPADARFIKYDGVEKVVLSPEPQSIPGIKTFERQRRKNFIHHFSFYK